MKTNTTDRGGKPPVKKTPTKRAPVKFVRCGKCKKTFPKGQGHNARTCGRGVKRGSGAKRPRNTPTSAKLAANIVKLPLSTLEAFERLQQKLKKPIFVSVNKRNERQAHGFNNEDRVKSDYELLDYAGETNGYTGKYDAQTKEGIPVSIKTEKLKSDVELGDYFRNAQVNQDFYLVVSFWENEKNNIVEEYHVKFPAEEWKKLFNHNLDDKIRRVIQEASNDYSYDAIWTQKIKKLKEEYGNNIIRLRPKRDHKTQKRMQCAISYADFLRLHDTYKTEDIKRNK